ncbi:hypothetical protein JCM10213v2_005452 [Rhodosporidiobolus nylandii]
MLPTVAAMTFYTRYLNKKKDKKLNQLITENGWTEEDVARERDKAAFLDLTDRENPFTRYINEASSPFTRSRLFPHGWLLS